MRLGLWALAGVGPVSTFAGTVLADVAPPSRAVPPSGLSAPVLIGFGVLVAIVAVASILVIRAIKKNGAPIDKP